MQRLSLRLSRMGAGQTRIPIYTRQLLQWEFTNVSKKTVPLQLIQTEHLLSYSLARVLM
ncbi:hypothetical protein D6C84_10442 [Aureobasidium pullulans]|uniref:Uncharacterized protein n=1 Tax=Aureobasidium pullulans TaxID=5580 RepID=A0A4S9WWY2_AURPU|nr:hypothetical protein D6C84_10442 [Aureobasidium pullulans]